MEFKEGDRVRVLRFSRKDVDFYGTLTYVDELMANLFDCTNKKYDYTAVFLPSDDDFGEDKEDYYVLAEDEEDIGGNNMPTIKRKVEMNLPQLIEWGWDNVDKVEGKKIKSNVKDVFGNYSIVQFSFEGYLFKTDGVGHKDTFTVEVEEEITEDTVIPKLLTTFKKTYLKYDFGYQRVRIDEDCKIQLMLNKAEAHGEKIETLHMVNDDGTHSLLWSDGE